MYQYVVKRMLLMIPTLIGAAFLVFFILRLLPGDVYGLDGYFRIGIGTPRSHLEPGLERIADYLRKNY